MRRTAIHAHWLVAACTLGLGLGSPVRGHAQATAAPAARDATARIEYQIGRLFEGSDRPKDAQAAYVRGLQAAPGRGLRDTLDQALRRVVRDQRDQERAGWAPPFARHWIAGWWPDVADLSWGGATLLVLTWLAAGHSWRRGKGLLVQSFRSAGSAACALDPAGTIEAMVSLYADVVTPFGLFDRAGVRLPIVSNSSAEAAINLVGELVPVKFLPDVLRRVADAINVARFTVGGRVETTPSTVRLFVSLHDRGKLVRTWDVSASQIRALDEESRVACELVNTIWERME